MKTSSPLLESYLRGLKALYDYRVYQQSHARNMLGSTVGAYGSPYGVTTAPPTAQQLAIEVMKSSTPVAIQGLSTPDKEEHKNHVFVAQKNDPEWLKKLYDRLDPIASVSAPGLGVRAVKAAAESTPGKAVIDILSRGNYASANAALAASTKGKDAAPEAFWRGLEGKDKTHYADVLEANFPDMGDRKKAALGLAGDVFLDPTTYIPLGWVGKLGKLGKGGAAATEATEKSLPVADDILRQLEGPSTPPKLPELTSYSESTPRFTAGATGVEDVFNPIKFADEIGANNLVSAINQTPKLAYPGLDITPPFAEVTSVTKKKVPVTREVEEPITPEAPKPISRSLASRRAIKLALLQSPDYKVRGRFAISDLLRTAKDNPERARDIEKLINDETNNLYRTKDFEGLKLVSSESGSVPGVTMGTRTGKGSFALTLDQATKLFSEGKIGGNVKNYDTEGVSQFLSNLPFHDVSDFEVATVQNAKGQQVSLKQYLADLGVKVEAVTPEGKTASVLDAPESASSVFDFVNRPTRKVQKVVLEEQVSKKTSIKKLDEAKLIAWELEHGKDLTPREVRYLRDAKDPEQFNARLKELATKTVAGNYRTLREVVAAHEAGYIPDKAWDDLLSTVGAKDTADLLARAENIFKKTGPSSTKKSTVEEILPQEGKIERFRGRPPGSPWEGVAPVADLINDPGRLKSPVPVVTSTLINDARHIISESVIKNLVTPQDLAKYPWVTTIKKTKRTSNVKGQGVGRNLHQWNQYSQSDMFRAAVKSASRDIDKFGLKGKELREYLKARPGLMYSRVMAALNFSEAALKKDGVKFVSGTDEGFLLSLADVLNSLPAATVRRYLFSRGRTASNVHPSKFLEVATNYVRASLAETDLTVAREISRSQLLDLRSGEKLTEQAADQLLADFERNLPSILQRLNINYAAESVAKGQSIKVISNAVIENVIRKYSDPSVPVGDMFSDLIERADTIGFIGRKIDAPAGTSADARVIVDSELNVKGIGGQALAEADVAKKFASLNEFTWRTSRPGFSHTSRKIGRQQQQLRAAEATKTASVAEEVDLAELYAARFEAGIFRANAPVGDKIQALFEVAGKAFYAPFGHGDFHYMVHRAHGSTQTFSRVHRALMGSIHDKAQVLAAEQAAKEGAPVAGLASKKLQEAFKLLQEGKVSTDAGMDALVQDMQKSLDILFSGGNNNVGSFAVRNGIFSDHLNSMLDFYGVPKQYRFDESVPLVQQTNSWRSWESVEDPLDLLDKVHAAYQRATVEVTLGRDISDTNHVWVSTTPKPGFSKITDSRGRSKVFTFMDSDLYYSKDVIKQLPYLDQFLKDSVFKSGGLLKLYDSVLHTWKASVTIYRPGHHVRNLIGDIGLSFLAGVSKPTVYRSAMRVLHTRGTLYKDWDTLQGLMSSSPAELSKSGGVQVKLNGKKIRITDDSVYKAAMQEGLLREYSALEDIAFTQSQNFDKVGVGKLRSAGRSVHTALGSVSQARDHWVRTAHFIDILEKGNFKNLQEAFTEAGKTVRKWHPDGSDLTAFERQTMRRLMPFYSWFRKAIPLVVESAYMNPGKAILLPKTSYNMAVAMGIDPESVTNPFPNDRLFPSWLQDNILGPQFEVNGNLYGINPGDPITDIGSSYGSSDAGSDIISSISPAIKIPIELMTGGDAYAKNLALGSKYDTGAEYWQAQIPGISHIGAMTNTNLFTGEPDKNVQRGYEKPGLDTIALINNLLGLGAVNYTKPNYTKSAEFEIRDRARREARNND